MLVLDMTPSNKNQSIDRIATTHSKTTRIKITRGEPILVRTPLKLDDAQPHAGGQPKNDVHTVLVKVETDEGVIGWGRHDVARARDFDTRRKDAGRRRSARRRRRRLRLVTRDGRLQRHGPIMKAGKNP